MVTAMGRSPPRSRAARAATARWWLGAMPTSAREPPSGRTRAIDQLRSPVSGSRATMQPAVMYGPPSCSKKRGMGRSARSGCSWTTSWHGPFSAMAGSSAASSAPTRCGPRPPSPTPSASAISARPASRFATSGSSLPRTRAMRTGSRRCFTSCAARPAAGSSSRSISTSRPLEASCASHGRSDCSSALDTERARAHELDDLTAVGPDRFSRRDEPVALAYLRVRARRADAER